MSRTTNNCKCEKLPCWQGFSFDEKISLVTKIADSKDENECVHVCDNHNDIPIDRYMARHIKILYDSCITKEFWFGKFKEAIESKDLYAFMKTAENTNSTLNFSHLLS